jgi:hypothetical protein
VTRIRRLWADFTDLFKRHPEDDRREGSRRSDRRQAVASVLIVFFVFAEGLWVQSIGHKVNSETRRRVEQRLTDSKRQCRKTSQRTAADVNLNWLYFQSETELTNERPSPKLRVVIRTLPQGDQILLHLLTASGNPSRVILKARAVADFNAAFAKASSVDVADAHLVNVVTPLGASPSPRRWVLKAGFSCAKAFQ